MQRLMYRLKVALIALVSMIIAVPLVVWLLSVTGVSPDLWNLAMDFVHGKKHINIEKIVGSVLGLWLAGWLLMEILFNGDGSEDYRRYRGNTRQYDRYDRRDHYDDRDLR